MAEIRVNYNLDIVFCIDATASMGSLLDTVKENAIHFYDDLLRVMEEKKKRVNDVRIKIVAFRDYLADGSGAMLNTNFFNLPAQREEFSNTIRAIEPIGGGDIPEDGLEALAYAIRSKWRPREAGTRNRQIVVLWTDAPPHPLGFGTAAPNYPAKIMAKNLEELHSWWGDVQNEKYMSYSAKRLILYAPGNTGERNCIEWTDAIRGWDNVLYYPSKAGAGIEDYSYQEILDHIAGSV